MAVQYKPTKCTFVKLTFKFSRCLLHVSNPRVNLQEDGYTYRNGKICLYTDGISILVGGRVCSVQSCRWTVCSVQSCRWKDVFGTVLWLDSVFGTVLQMEGCVRYSPVDGRMCSVQSCREESVFGTILQMEGCVRHSLVERRVCSVQSCRWKDVFGTVLYVGQCVRYSPVDGWMCSVQSCREESVFEDCLYHIRGIDYNSRTQQYFIVILKYIIISWATCFDFYRVILRPSRCNRGRWIQPDWL